MTGGFMRKFLGLIGLIAVLLIAAAPAQATFPGANGKLVISNIDHHPAVPSDGSRTLFTVNPDGTGLTVIEGFFAADGHWSPDGTKLAFRTGVPVSEGHPTPNILVANADGS